MIMIKDTDANVSMSTLRIAILNSCQQINYWNSLTTNYHKGIRLRMVRHRFCVPFGIQ
jgi:hypothetical protein